MNKNKISSLYDSFKSLKDILVSDLYDVIDHIALHLSPGINALNFIEHLSIIYLSHIS